VEVGPRDGLQNESKTLAVADRVHLIEQLVDAGLCFLEAGSFVSPKAIPQMVSSEEIVDKTRLLKADLSYLVPNMKGLERAQAARVKSIAVFTATSDAFNQKNIGMTVDESFKILGDVVPAAQKSKMRVRGYLSTAFGCPYEGVQKVQVVDSLVRRLFDLGCDEVSVGDTIGVAHPHQVSELLKILIRNSSYASRLALHFHDTRGMALVNIKTALDLGIRIFDSSIGGLGGCPYAKGASGNVATEELIWLFEGLGLKTEVSLEKLLKIAAWVEEKVERPLKAKLYLSKPKQIYYFSR
jgi:hydroxymethylglutaryl-CoA lyase